MSDNDFTQADFADLESRLRQSVLGGAELGTEAPDTAQGRVLSLVRAYVRDNPGGATTQWSRRFLIFAAVAAPAALAAAVAIAVISHQPQRGVVPAPATSPQTSPPPVTPSPAAPAEALIVITQRTGGATQDVRIGSAPDTVLLTKVDGTVAARAAFKPTERPLWTNAATITPPQVHVANGAAYFIDGDGVVRRLDRDGAVTAVASFPTTEAQHMTSFAVSPDGTKLMASIFTWGAKTGLGLPGPFTVGPSYDDLEYADAGGATKVLSHAPLATTTGHFMVVGWDQGGPIAGTAVAIATQNPTSQGWNSPIYHLDLSGNQTQRLGGSDCLVSIIAEGGDLMCSGSAYAGTAIQVRTPSGGVLYALPTSPPIYEFAAISPSNRVALGRWSSDPTSHSNVYGRGYQASIPDDFSPTGWIDTNVLVGFSGDLNKPTLATISITGNQAGPVKTFPVNGIFAGVINP